MTIPCSLNMITPIVKGNLGNIFYHKNLLKQIKYVQKNTGKQYQSRPFQIPKNFSSTYTKENILDVY